MKLSGSAVSSGNADKLYFSGKAKNWELANWYRWKLEAAALAVIEGRVEPYRYERL